VVLVMKTRQAPHAPSAPQHPSQQVPLQQTLRSPQLVRLATGTHAPPLQTWHEAHD
jgi:hypothetical protein